MLRYVAVFALVAVNLAQDFDYDPAPRPAPARLAPKSPPPPPVAIIKQINRHDDDGSYTYGYESADGSFKIETKLPNGEVKGKYGYVDDVGKVRIIEYGATKYGFAPAGEGITVPPPTIVDETTDKSGNLLPEYSGAYDQPDDEPIRSQPAYSSAQSGGNFEFSSLPASRPAARPAPAPRPVSRPAPLEYSPPQSFEPAPIRASAPSPAPSSFTLDFPSRPAPGPPSRPSFSPAPAPPRPSFSNAVPLEDFGGLPSRPAPRITHAQPAPFPQRPANQPSFGPPPPRPSAAPQYRPAPQSLGQRPGGGGSILDQLSKEYALPQSENSSPLHEISFGYF